MKPFPKIHDLYVGRVVLGSVLLTWSVLVGLDALLAVVTELGDVGTNDYGYGAALAYVAYTVPRRLHMMFPTAAVIGSLLGLGQLATSSELTALRAVGLSRPRLSAAVAGTLIALTAVMMLTGETIGPWGEHRADSLKASAKSKDLIVAQYSGLWAREGDTFLNAQTGQERNDGNDPRLELRDVRLYEFAKDGRLESIAHAGTAEHRPSGWLLRNVKRSYFEAKTVTQTEVMEERWDSQLDAAALAASAENMGSARYMPVMDLRSGIQYRKRNGLDASDLENHYWGRLFYPVNVLALCLAAIPFAFGTLRSGGLGKRLFIGIVFALGFWLLQTQFVSLAGVYKFDFRIAYLVPPALMLAISTYLFRRRSG